MTVKRVFLWGLSFLLVGLTIYFIVMEIAFQREEPAYQRMRARGWTIYTFQGNPISCSPHGKDMTIDRQGKIWVTGGCAFDGIHVFDGAQWLTYTQENSALEWDGYGDIAIDSLGQVVAHALYNNLVVFNGEKWDVYNESDLDISDGEIWGIGTTKIGTDDQEYLWFSVNYGNKKPKVGYVLQGDVWVKCFDGTDPLDKLPSSRNPNCVKDADERPPPTYIDEWGRIWTWRTIANEDYYYEIRVSNSDGSHWLTLTPENSGLGKSDIEGLVVDGLQRLWVLEQYGGVRMVPLENLELIPQEIVNQRSETLKIRESTAGYIWFLPSILVIVLLANYLNMLPGILLALGIGVIITILVGKSPIMPMNYGKVLNPGALATYGGMIGGLLGGLKNRKSSTQGKSTRWNYIGAIIGLVVGFVLGVGWLFLVALATSP